MALRRVLRAIPRTLGPWRAATAGGASGGSGSGGDDEWQSYIREAFGDSRLGEVGDTTTTAGVEIGKDSLASEGLVKLKKLPRVPAKYDLLSSSFCYEWLTTAQHARKIHGPMHEWADELKYRTGVHIETDITRFDRFTSGEYKHADDVEITVYLFGSERNVESCRNIMESALLQSPCYVRLAVFRRTSTGVEWLTLRRINRDLRPPDIPPISLKTPGKYTLLYEGALEAAVRTLWEETGISVSKNAVTPTSVRMSTDPTYYWRVPVRYFIAEVPADVEVLGPQTNTAMYMQHWDARLRQSADPTDRVWAQKADPNSHTAWLTSSTIDELQLSLRGPHYMSSRYFPPPHSSLQEATGLAPPPQPPAPPPPPEAPLP